MEILMLATKPNKEELKKEYRKLVCNKCVHYLNLVTENRNCFETDLKTVIPTANTYQVKTVRLICQKHQRKEI